MLNKVIKIFSTVILSWNVRCISYIALLFILMLGIPSFAQNRWKVHASFEYAGSHNPNGPYSNLFYLASGLKYDSKFFSLETIIPIVSQNGDIYTQVGKMIVKNSGLNHPDTTAGEGHVPGSVVDGETITNLSTGLGDILLFGNIYIQKENRNLPTIVAETFIKFPTASNTTQLGTNKVDFGFSLNLEKTIWGLISSAGFGYWILGTPDGHTLQDPFAFNFSVGKEFKKEGYTLFIMYEGYSKIANNYSAPKELSLLLQYLLSANTIMSIKASTGLSSSSPDFIFETNFDFNL
jgi:Putative MetA-pathway of phenol degradation